MIFSCCSLSLYRNPSREEKCHSNESHETLRCSGSSARIPVSNQAGGLTGCSQ